MNTSNPEDKQEQKLPVYVVFNRIMQQVPELLRKYPLFFIVFSWSVAQFTAWRLFGIVTDLEGLKYIRAAEHLLQTGHFPEKRYWFYSVTTGLIALSKQFQTGYSSVFLIQLIYSLTAHLFFYKSLKSVSNEKDPAPLITTLLLCCMLPYQSWNLTLYTESVFYSSVLLFFSSCILLQKFSLKNTLLQLLLLVPVIASRPLGILLLLPWIVYLFLKAPVKYSRYFFLCMAAGGLLLLTVSNLILSSIGDWNILAPFQEGYIICDLGTSDSVSIHLNNNGSPIQQLLLYVQQHPGHFLRMSLKKTAAFFLLTRSYYSPLHNVTLYLLAALLYVPVLMVFFKKKLDAITIMSLCIILIVWTAVVLQCDDYHNRFHFMLLPVFLFVGCFSLLQRTTHK